MKRFFVVAIMLGALLLGLGYANPDALSSEETARVKSMLEVTGVAIVKKGATKAVNKQDKDGNPVLEHVLLKSSAVINDTIVWEGETVTLKEEKVQVRLED